MISSKRASLQMVYHTAWAGGGSDDDGSGDAEGGGGGTLAIAMPPSLPPASSQREAEDDPTLSTSSPPPPPPSVATVAVTPPTTTLGSDNGGGGGDGGGEQKRLFDCVLVVAVNTSKAVKNLPYVTYHYPYPPSFMKAVTQFCFPDISNTDKVKKEEIFSFVLTEANGEKRWGYCHRLFPQCFCIVSYLPCFSIFHMILKKVIKLHQNALSGTEPSRPFPLCTCLP